MLSLLYQRPLRLVRYLYFIFNLYEFQRSQFKSAKWIRTYRWTFEEYHDYVRFSIFSMTCHLPSFCVCLIYFIELQNIHRCVFQFLNIIYTSNSLDSWYQLFKQYAQLFIWQQSYWNNSHLLFGSSSSSETVSSPPLAFSSFWFYGSL